MRALVEREQLEAVVFVDSAGTSAYHVGEPPDARSREAARERGIDISGSARQFRKADWDAFDYVVAMDAANHETLLAMTTSNGARGKLHLLRAFDADSPPDASVPDPYYGGPRGFEEVLDLCEKACRGLLEHVRRERGL